LYAWLISPEGAAIASWLASIAAIVAIVIALTAYFGEIGRARHERMRAAKRQRDAYRNFTEAVSQVIARARDRIAQSAALAEAASNGSMVGMPDHSDRLRVALMPIIDTINGMRLATPFDAELAIALSEAASTMREIVAKPLGKLPPAAAAAICNDAVKQLDEATKAIRRRGGDQG
jgi:hypothetical protein